jgi:peptide/nickel transport system permease protein
VTGAAAGVGPNGPGELAPPERQPEAGQVGTSTNFGRLVLRAFVEHRLALVGVGIVVFMILFSFVAPLFYVTDQIHTHPLDVTQPPSVHHLLGTDDVGYDVLGRLMLAGQSSLEVGIGAALLASTLGTAWGAIAGYFGGAVDGVMMRLVDSFLSIPPLLLILMLASIFTPTVPVLILVIALISWLGTARLVRGECLSLRVREYVLAAKGTGARSPRILLRHLVPNVMGTIVVLTTFAVADAVLLLAALSYLGLGVPPPAANWGGMLTNGLNYVYSGYWWLIYPAGVAIVLTVVAFNFIGDALRDAFEVRLQRR